MTKKAVVLVSGGVDSVTTAAIAKNMGYEVYPVSFMYNQRHKIELNQAKKSLESLGINNHKVVNLDLSVFGGSALTDINIEVPKYQNASDVGDIVPITYVPARNTIFLSMALAYAEVLGAYDIFIGVHSQDSSNYPDCRKNFIESFENTANKAVGYVSEAKKIKVHVPLIDMKKSDIIKIGLELGVDYSDTISCYDPSGNGVSCGNCHACLIRLDGFKENNIEDPIEYR